MKVDGFIYWAFWIIGKMGKNIILLEFTCLEFLAHCWSYHLYCYRIKHCRTLISVKFHRESILVLWKSRIIIWQEDMDPSLFFLCVCVLYAKKKKIIKFAILTTCKYTVCGINYTRNDVQPLPLSILKTFSSLQTETLYPLA